MRRALSGTEISNKDGSLNHSYFNTKKGFYWSEKNTEALVEGIIKHGLDIGSIRGEVFRSNKSQIEL